MSYGVVIWGLTPTAPDEEALGRYQAAMDGDERDLPATSLLAAAYRELTARFPDVDAQPDDDADGLEYERGERYLHVSMSFGDVDEVLPYVIATAQDHGLTVFDPQLGRTLRPGDDLRSDRSVEEDDAAWAATVAEIDAIDREIEELDRGRTIRRSDPGDGDWS